MLLAVVLLLVLVLVAHQFVDEGAAGLLEEVDELVKPLHSELRRRGEKQEQKGVFREKSHP